MLIVKVQQILVENRHNKREPKTMTQVAATVGISERRLYQLIDLGRPEDIERIAKGLGVEPTELSP